MQQNSFRDTKVYKILQSDWLKAFSVVTQESDI